MGRSYTIAPDDIVFVKTMRNGLRIFMCSVLLLTTFILLIVSRTSISIPIEPIYTISAAILIFMGIVLLFISLILIKDGRRVRIKIIDYYKRYRDLKEVVELYERGLRKRWGR